jgi:hypothetical protein
MSDVIGQDLLPVAASICVYFVWALVPLLPAVVIYRLFPAAPTATQWKVLGIALKAGGASGFYFAILGLAFFKFVGPTTDYINNLQQPYWLVDVPIMFFDADKNVINASSSLEQLRVEPFAYEFVKTGERRYLVKMRFAGFKGEVPDNVRLIFPEGEGFIELRKLKTKENTDRILKKIDLTKEKPIEIRPLLIGGQNQPSVAALPPKLVNSLENN